MIFHGRRSKARDGQFKSWDGVELFYRQWEPVTPGPQKRAIILMHRGHEHSGRVQDIVDGLDMGDYWAFAYDARGHGRSPGPRGYADNFSDLVKDLDHFVNWISSTHGIAIEDIAVVANSVGAVVASTWVHDFAPRIRSLVLAAPAFRVKLYVPFALPSLRVLDMIRRPSFISSYVKGRMLTHDLEEAKRYHEDPLVTRDIAVNILLGLFDASTRLLEDAQAIVVPTMILSAGKDFVVKLSAQKQFYERLGSRVKEMHVFPTFYHGVFYEQGKEAAINQARKFLLASFEKPIDRSFVRNADREGASYSRYLALARPAGIFSALFWGMQTAFLKTVGRLSEGIRIGFKHGFDSGLSLDHVYKNVASGTGGLGRLIDRIYLNAAGWRGIRIRKINLENALEQAIVGVQARGEKVRIVDMAGGPGRYLLDIAARNRDVDLSIQVRDNDEDNLAEGRKLAQTLGVTNVKYEEADAFLDSIRFEGTSIVVISGLMELFPSNGMITRVIDAASRALKQGGYVIYTGQPWHPQQEMIARTLPNREGKRWIMRMRTQAELDELMRAYGLEKISSEIDEAGIFSVSVARKMAPAASAGVAKGASNAIRDGQSAEYHPQA
jgi:alpha-beta hydrolase superfamily lysophospholipase/ubiquinone/menaquinone biosynthesis C-methylase UbiE